MLAFRHDIWVAEKIAEQLNAHNNLQKKYTAKDINYSRAVYYPIVISNCLLASVALDRLNFLITEVKHLVVPEKLRGLGLAKSVLKVVIAEAQTPYLIASVRSNNIASLKVFDSLGFSLLAQVKNNDNHLTLLGRLK